MLLDFSSLDGMLPNSREYAASGGVQSGGAAIPAKTKTYVPSGGGTLGGGAVVTKTKNVLIIAGGVLVGGSAITVGPHGQIHNFIYMASGGAKLNGSADGIIDHSGSVTHFSSLDREGSLVLTTRHFLSDPNHADFLARTNGTLNERGKRRHLDQGEDAHRG